MQIKYKPQGVCSKLMQIEVEEGIIKKVEITGGCSGNLQGISRLIVGQKVEEVIPKIDGIRCGFKTTSCPDQLAKALIKCIEND